MGTINTIGQFAGAGALSASGFLAVKYTIAGGASIPSSWQSRYWG